LIIYVKSNSPVEKQNHEFELLFFSFYLLEAAAVVSREEIILSVAAARI
jgi:hypothetical protein